MASVVLAAPCFLLIQSAVPVLVVLGVTVAVPNAALSYPYAAFGTVMTGLSPASTRFSGVAMAQNGAGVLSSFVPLLATAWVAGAGNHWWPAAVMLAVIALVTGLAGLVAPWISHPIAGFKP